MRSNGSAKKMRPKAAGVAMMKTQRKAQSMVLEKALAEAEACFLDKLGKITVASAIPNTPSGNSTSRSE